MSIVVTATVRPRPESRSEVKKALEELVAKVHVGDEGCELFALHESTDEFVIIEKWRNRAALNEHSGAEPSVTIHEQLAGKLLNPPVTQVLTAVLAGDPALGVL